MKITYQSSKMEETTRKASGNSFKNQATMVDLQVMYILSVCQPRIYANKWGKRQIFIR